MMEPQVPESPKPLAFTVDFGEGKSVDPQRHKNLVEKLQRKHRRGQSLSKLEEPPVAVGPRPKHPLTGNLPRKFSFQSEGYFSSDEAKVVRASLTLPLKNVASEKMGAPSPCTALFSLDATPEVQLKDVSSPELDPISPFTDPGQSNSSPEQFVDGTEFDFDKSDTVSDAGTYTLDADNYSEEQKARMSIDREFKIEQISQSRKTEEYVRNLCNYREKSETTETSQSKSRTQTYFKLESATTKSRSLLSPILSPTQNLSITQNGDEKLNNAETSRTFTKIMFPSSKARENNGLGQLVDQGCVISVTSSGAFKGRVEAERELQARRRSLSTSAVQVQAYVGNKLETCNAKKLTANIINVESIQQKNGEEKVSNLPPAVGGHSGKFSPTKIPSPIHALRPRSRSSNVDLLSDSSLETESYLKPTQNCINSLQQRLSLDESDQDDYGVFTLNNNTHSLLKQRGTHIRHNSLDDRISNKLEHFQTKNLQGIDQTNMFNQYGRGVMMHKIQNSPNNSPIRRSSSFSAKNQLQNTKNTNITQLTTSAIQRSASTANIKPQQVVRRASVTPAHRIIDRDRFGDTESSSEDDLNRGPSNKKKDLSNLTTTRYNRAFSLRRARLDEPVPTQRCPNTPEMRRKFPMANEHARAISVDRKPMKTNDVQSRYLQNSARKLMAPLPKVEPVKLVPKVAQGNKGNGVAPKTQVFSRTDSGRFSMRTSKPPPVGGAPKPAKKDTGKKSNGRSNSSLSSREKEFQNWKRRKSYDPMKAAAEGKRKEIVKKQNVMTQSYTEGNGDCDSSPSHSSSVHRSQSFHGTAALEQLISSEDEDDLTLSADEGFSPPSPCELSPMRASLRNAWKDHVLH